MDKIPTSRLSRGKVIGKAALKIGFKKTKSLIVKDSKEQTQEEIANIILEALNELKGLSVKIAQTLALGMPFLEPQYLEKISKSFNKITPLNRALVRKIIKSELGKYPEQIYDNFDLTAFASASLGQVHRAIKDGKEMAVKIQYPAIAKTIQSDLSILAFGLKRFSGGADVEHILQELKDRLNEELDYTKEAQNLKAFKSANRNSNIVIAEVFDEFSTSKVLTTSYIKGQDFESFLKSKPSQEEIDNLAQLIFDNFFETLYNIKTIHADPNPGNFLFLEDGKLGLIDFGCVKKVNREFLDLFNKLHLALINGVEDLEIAKIYLEMGMIKISNDDEMLKFYKEIINPLDTIYIEIFKEKKYNFKNSNYSKRGFEAIIKVQKKQATSVQNYNQDYIFIDRTLLGYYAMFEKMGATIDTSYVKKIMERYNDKKS